MARNYLVTGGAGFIGSNYVARLVRRGENVTIFDNLSRDGARRNLQWLRKEFGTDGFKLIVADVRDADAIKDAACKTDVIVHLAAQVTVTTSVTYPREDFEINALGTFNVLEAARSCGTNPAFLYTSTNKVYGGMEDMRVAEEELRYHYIDFPLGIPESQPVDFHSPYGCSKGCGDQYVRDYQRIYGIPSVVFRQSCIYGLHQFGMEDQGWIAWFIIAVLTGKPITIFGDGKQVRDVLFIDDLMDAYDLALANIDRVAGKIYNIGGGPDKTLSVWKEFAPLLEKLAGHPIPTGQGDWRPGDQRIYVSDIGRAKQELGWAPAVAPQEGITRLFEWVKNNPQLFE